MTQPRANVGNAADEQQQDRAKQRIVERAVIERDDVRKSLSTREGRRELWRLLARCGVHQTSFAGEQPLTMAFREGERNVGIWAEQRAIDHAPDLYLIMQHEAANQENT